jgi:hypothetical protein
LSWARAHRPVSFLWGMVRDFVATNKEWSERQDLNLRRLGPKPSALPG